MPSVTKKKTITLLSMGQANSNQRAHLGSNQSVGSFPKHAKLQPDMMIQGIHIKPNFKGFHDYPIPYRSIK